MNRIEVLHQARNGIRIAFWTLLGTGTTAAAGFAGTHYYLERQEPTPSTWPTKARFAYRAAVFNQRYLDQPEAARLDLQDVLTVLKEHDPNALAQGSGLAKVWLMLGDTARKRGQPQEALEDYISALGAVPAERTFAALRSDCARKLGEVQERLGFMAEAAGSLDLAVRCFFPDHQPGTPLRVLPTARHEPEMLAAVKSHALFRTRQGHLKEALNTLMSVLQYEEVHPQITIHSCQTASTMSNIAEIVWALGSPAECERWATKSLHICLEQQNKHDDFCGECAANNYNTLGLLAKKAGDLPEARKQFTKALLAAERSKYQSGLYEFSSNLDACHR